jgi:hypothetical protein
MKFIKYVLSMFVVLHFGFGGVNLSLDNYNESAGTVDVNYTSDEDISGLQFDITGADIVGASGGDAGGTFDVLSTSATTVIGFSFTGATISAGSGLLLTLEIENISGATICLDSPVMASSSGTLETTLGDCLIVGDLPGCTDTNACNYNSSATVDDGACEYPDEGFDCSGDSVIGED